MSRLYIYWFACTRPTATDSTNNSLNADNTLNSVCLRVSMQTENIDARVIPTNYVLIEISLIHSLYYDVHAAPSMFHFQFNWFVRVYFILFSSLEFPFQFRAESININLIASVSFSSHSRASLLSGFDRMRVAGQRRNTHSRKHKRTHAHTYKGTDTQSQGSLNNQVNKSGYSRSKNGVCVCDGTHHQFGINLKRSMRFFSRFFFFCCCTHPIITAATITTEHNTLAQQKE